MWQAQGRSSNVNRNWNLTHIKPRHTKKFTHTHYLPSPSPLCAASVKAEALKCKRFMKFIYVPVKMPTAAESRRERERGGRGKREVYLGQANITFPSTGSGCHHNFSLLRRSRKRICDKTHSSRPRPTTSLPPLLPLGPAGPWLGAVGWAQLTEGWASPWRLLQLVSNDSERRAPSWLNPVKI